MEIVLTDFVETQPSSPAAKPGLLTMENDIHFLGQYMITHIRLIFTLNIITRFSTK